MWGNVVINIDDVMTGYVQSDPDKAIKNVKDVLMAYKYHQQPTIATNWKNQAKRVGEMLTRMDQEIPINVLRNGYDAYQSMNLEAEWTAWISGRIYVARQKAEQYMEYWVNKLKDGYITATTSTDPEVLARIEKIRKLEEAVIAAADNAWGLGEGPF